MSLAGSEGCSKIVVSVEDENYVVIMQPRSPAATAAVEDGDSAKLMELTADVFLLLLLLTGLSLLIMPLLQGSHEN